MSRSTGTNQERITLLEEQLQSLLTQTATLQSENNDLRQSVTHLSANPPPSRQVTPDSTTSATTTRTSEPKVAHPEFYHGQRNKLSTFITQVTMVITLQPNRFTTEEAKVLYAGSFLRDTAFLWFQPSVTANPKPDYMFDFNKFCTELRKTFGDPDEVATAERHLYALRQRGSASAYLADFMRHAVLVKWNDEAKAAQFYRGLKENVKDELSRIGKPATFQDLQDAAIRIDTRLFERQVEKGDRPPTTMSSGTRTFAQTYNRPGYRTNSTVRTESTYTRPTESTFTRPTESLRAGFTSAKDRLTKRGKITPSEYQRRKDNNLCLYCAEKGHSVKECPVAPPAQQQRNYSIPRGKE